MSLQLLPYDLLFNIAQDLDIDDVHNLQATCKSLRLFTLTRPVYRQLAHDLLTRSRPLPLHAFQRLSDLSTPALIAAVDRARGLEKAWSIRAPRPAKPDPYYGNRWYTTISVPTHEEIDWLSPITSSYTLCATKSGRVLCWDVRRDICLSEWDPRSLASSSGECDDSDDADDEEKWELWKCRVEFEERTVYFTMARVLKGYHDDRVMEFMLMRLSFPEELDDYDEINQSQIYVQSPILSHLDHDASAVEPQPEQPQHGGDSPISITPRVPSPQHPPPSIPIHDQPPTPTPSPPSSQTPSPHDSSLLHSGSFGPSSATSSAQCSPMAINAILPPDSTECSDQPQLNGIPSTQANTVGIRGDGGAGDPYQGPVFCHPSLRAMFIRSAPATPSWERYIPLPLHFDPPPPPAVSNVSIPDSARPVFDTLTIFHTTGVIMNVFLLDPPRRLLSAFVWIASSNTIGLYVLLDWAKEDYVFVDTGVGCLISSNWSCILHEDQIVIHSEEAEAAYQHFYPLEVLRAYCRPRCTTPLPAHAPPQAEQENEGGGENVDVSLKNLYKLPMICARLAPSKSISKKFVFPRSSGPAGGTPPIAQSGPNVSVVVVLSDDDVAEAQSEEDAEDVDATDATEEDQNGTGPVNEEEATSESEVPSTLPHSNDELLVDEETASDEEQPEEGPEDERDEEDSPLTATEVSEIPAGDETGDEESENGDDAEEPSDSQGEDDVDEVRVEDELNAGSSSSSQADNNSDPATQNEEDALSSQTPAPTTSEPQQTTEGSTPETETFTNPYPFPPWYPESAHFVRQWWPTLSGVPRLSCTVVLLAAHDPETHRTRFVLAQHYFKVPIAPDTLPVVGETGTSSSPRPTAQPDDDDMLHLWYVSTPFEVVCVLDEGDDDEEAGGRPRPLVAVDFGHAVWVEYAASVGPPNLDVRANASDESLENTHDTQQNAEQLHAHFAHFGDDHVHAHPRRRVPKCLRFVTFPPVYGRRGRTGEAAVRTLEIPEELDLDIVETINIDQSQGAVILSVMDGKVFILRYE